MTAGLAQPLSRRESNKKIKQMALYDSAMALFSRASYQTVSVDDICAHAGYGRTTFYRLFGEKAALLEEFNRRLAEAIARLGAQEALSGLAALKHAIGVMTSEVARHDTVVAEMIFEYVRVVDRYDPDATGYREGAVALTGLMARYIREGQAGGDIRRDIDAAALASMVMGQVSLGFIGWAREQSPSTESLKRVMAQTADFVLHGMAAV